MTDDGFLDLQQLSKSHGAAFTLTISELTIARGEVLALIGPTGAGKSTLLRLLAGLDNPSSGHIRFDGNPFIGDRLTTTTRHRIATVFQRPLLLSRSVQANVEYPLQLRGTSGSQADRVRKLLERFDLWKLRDQAAGTLSGGQTHLVALARALVVEPDLLLLDEPTANLDPGNVALVEEVVRDLQQARGMTIVWATHNLFQARRVADRVALLLEGRLVEVGATDKIFETPADPRTADFVQGRTIY